MNGRGAREGLDARRMAFDVLLHVETSSAFADALLGRALAGSSLAAHDRALATRLVYGTLAWQRRLDWLADHWARPKCDRLEPPVRIALRLGLFQLFFSDRIPPFAAVDTAVELAKQTRPAAAGLVNAVLRRAAREGAPTPPTGTRADELGLRWSHPDWMVQRWLDDLGAERTESILRANNEGSPLVLRAPARPSGRDDLLRSLRETGANARAGSYSPCAVIVEGGFPPEGFGEAMPQGEASQLVPLLLAADDGARWLDACASPGGKASQLADLIPEEAVLVAIDIHQRGLRRIRELTRDRADLAVADAAAPPFPTAAFDAALVDAPCSGTGTLRSHPEIRWRLRPQDVEQLTARQRGILEGVAALVRTGGTLVYATCSLFRDENDAVVEAFLAAHREWIAVDPRRTLPTSAHVLVDDGALRTSPDRHGLDGFFAVRLERRDTGSATDRVYPVRPLC
jgi:16S rRNA (cytosine967-C5)-methyltransferase